MPRSKAKKKLGPEGARKKQEEVDRALSAMWDKYIDAGLDKKKEFNRTAAEVDDFFENADQKKCFAELGKKVDLTGAVAAPVNLAFQIRGWIGPGLYHRNPTRKVTVRTNDGTLRARARCVEVYLNYTPNECALAPESRRGIDEALLAGRGVGYTGMDPIKKLVTSWVVSVDDVVIDPDARKPEDALWIAYRRRIPLWQAKREFGEPARDLEADRISEGQRAREGATAVDEPTARRDAEVDLHGTNDMVTVYEVYSKMGMGWRGHGCPEELRGRDDPDPYRKLVIAQGHDRPLAVGKWEAPLYLDRDWPFAFLDLTPSRNKLWPISLMGAAMPHQKNINVGVTMWGAKVKSHARSLFFTKKGLPETTKNLIASGPLDTLIELGEDGDMLDARQAIQKFDPGPISPEMEKLVRFHEEQFGATTGLLPILKGGGFEQQSRSATESDIKDRNARSRVTDMSERVEDWHSLMARHEGIMVCLDLDAEEVERVVGGPADAKLGWLVSLRVLGAEVPVRTRPTDEEEAAGAYDLETLHGPCGTYYQTQEDAMAGAMELAQMLAPGGPIQTERASRGLPPVMVDVDAMGAPAIGVRQVTVRDVWRDTAYLTVEDVCRELSFRVEAGSTKRPDPNQAIDQANTLMANTGAVALKMGDVVTYNKCLKALFEAQAIPEAQRVYLPEVPPPVLAQAAGGPAGAPGAMDGGAGFSFAGGAAPQAKVGA
jgi:hypothetical protein